ncbi:hypothetical protein BDV97DRAFT_367652 [Delphinella strobiligena]|nr:hypothetical protein BDV97DRAFT_367652 [Delphinella strobiligena]
MANGSEINKTVKDAVSGAPGEDKQKRLLEQPNTGHFNMVRALHLADLITLLNVHGSPGFCGINSILSSLRYCLGDQHDYSKLYLALGLIPLGLFFDFFDGRVARWRNKSSLMGAELDSLADLISFCLSPAAAALAIGLRTTTDQFLLTSFALCGLLRLARFNVTAGSVPHDASGKAKYFEGLPTPTSLAIVFWMTYWVSQGWTGDDVPFGLMTVGGLDFHPVVFVFIAHGCAMISKTMHVPKP